MTAGKKLVVIGGALIAIAAFFPWVGLSGISMASPGAKAIASTEGVISCGIGVALMIIGYVIEHRPGKRFSIMATIAAIAGALPVLNYLSGHLEVLGWGMIFRIISIGSYATLFGVVVALAGSLLTAPSARDAAQHN